MDDHTRVLVLGLDGYDPGFAESLLTEGRMPNLARLIADSARATLDHGKHRLTGLSWEHFATGLTPDELQRWSAVSFDPATYRVRQPTTTAEPFLASLGDAVVVFDPPYFDLGRAPRALGLVNWGAHDPGVAAMSRPANLQSEVAYRFGTYPGAKYIYGFVWPSEQQAKAAAEALTQAVSLRTEISRWLLAERLPDWKVACIVVGELHSVIEPMWHGIDASHPLHGLPSATAAAHGVRSVYLALDDMIGTLREAFPDATLVAFCMHGMGANNADVASMLLLPEFCYRRAFGQPLFSPRPAWVGPFKTDGTPPQLDDGDKWEAAVRRCFPLSLRLCARLRKSLGKLPRPLRAAHAHAHREAAGAANLDWMPATAYAPCWPAMDAFALPSFYDGRIRVNLAGRERLGRIAIEDYYRFRDALEAELVALRNPATGEPAVEELHHPHRDDPRQLHDTEPDIEIVWRQATLTALASNRLGTIGPAPIRRTGGHTGGHGVLYLLNSPLPAGDYGHHSAFDVAPTVAELAGDPDFARLSGRSLLAVDGKGKAAPEASSALTSSA
jgi:predicted AlkP superfamily phosphohydrolase/phosphomutase